MANTFAIRSTASGGISFVNNGSYAFVELDRPRPNYERQTRSGCGTAGSKTVKRQMVDMTIPIVITCLGSDGDTRAANRDAVLLELEKAILYETGETADSRYDGLPRYVIRVVDNQSPSDVYQIVDYEFAETRLRDHNKFWQLPIDLKVWPGQKIPANADLTGLTVTSILGGIGRVVLGSDGFPVHIGAL